MGVAAFQGGSSTGHGSIQTDVLVRLLGSPLGTAVPGQLCEFRDLRKQRSGRSSSSGR